MLLPLHIMSQNCDPRDVEWGLRLGGTLGYKIDNAWAFDISWESRIENDISEYEESMIDLASSYKFSNGIKLHSIYRHKFIPNNTEEYRVTVGASYAKFIGDTNLEWGIRTRLQRDQTYGAGNEEYTTRNKLSLVYEINHVLGVVIEDELFYTLSQDAQWDKNRITTGIEWEITSDIEFVAFYRFENELNTKVSDYVHTIGMYLEYNINTKDRNSEVIPEHFGHPYRW